MALHRSRAGVWGFAIVAIAGLSLVACSDVDVGRGGMLSSVPSVVTVSGLSAFQTEILSDGRVTDAEMERAAFSYVTCMETNLGIRVEIERHDNSQDYGYAFFGNSGSGDVEAIVESEEGRACWQEYLSDVELRWADQVGPTEREIRALFDRVAICLRKEGFDVPDSSPETLSAWIEREPNAYDRCLDEAESDE